MIRIQVDEYEYLVEETETLHRESLALIRNYIKELNELLVPMGGFHADMISEKVKLLLQMFQEQLVTEMEQTFWETERQIQIFGAKLAECDESGKGRVKWEE